MKKTADFMSPYIYWAIDSHDRFLKDEIHNWLVDYKIVYSLMVERDYNPYTILEWYIEIDNINMATLFKLTWL